MTRNFARKFRFMSRTFVLVHHLAFKISHGLEQFRPIFFWNESSQFVRQNSLSFVLQSTVVYFEKHYRKNMDYNSYEAVKGKGCIFTRQAGSGKTTLLCEMVKFKTEKTFILAFSNKAIIDWTRGWKLLKQRQMKTKVGYFSGERH